MAKSFHLLLPMVLGAAAPMLHAEESAVGHEHGNFSMTSVGSPGFALGVHKLVAYDTSGGITAGLRGAMNENAARTNKEYDLERGKTLNNSYSWNPPAPSPAVGATLADYWKAWVAYKKTHEEYRQNETTPAVKNDSTLTATGIPLRF